MRDHNSEDEEPLEDTTVAIPLRSKRTERMQRKKVVRDRKDLEKTNLLHLPAELVLAVLEQLRPSDVFNMSRVSQRFHALVGAHANALGDVIIGSRYRILARCLPPPVLLSRVEPWMRPLLTHEKRQQALNIHKKPYQHVQPPDVGLVCTCVACVMAWNNLGLVLDFAHWQRSLDAGEPIPMLPRGKPAPWNDELVGRNARTARAALGCSLWHARILEAHLSSTVKSVQRHQKNKGNMRKHVSMTDDEAATGTDDFLDKEGPPSLEFPYNRDEYYMLEAYLPNRWWKKFDQRWLYTLEGQHERDLELVIRYSKQYDPAANNIPPPESVQSPGVATAP